MYNTVLHCREQFEIESGIRSEIVSLMEMTWQVVMACECVDLVHPPCCGGPWTHVGVVVAIGGWHGHACRMLMLRSDFIVMMSREYITKTKS